MSESLANMETPQHFVHGPTLYRTGPNRYRLICGMCGEICFVDDTAFRRASHAIMAGQDNPFLCRDCDHVEEEIWRFAE